MSEYYIVVRPRQRIGFRPSDWNGSSAQKDDCDIFQDEIKQHVVRDGSEVAMIHDESSDHIEELKTKLSDLEDEGLITAKARSAITIALDNL